MKHVHVLAVIFLLLSGCVPAVAQESFNAVCSFDSIRSKTGGRTDPTPVPKVTGLSFTSFKAVPASGNVYKLSANPTSSRMFAFAGWPVCDSVNMTGANVDPSQYYSFKIVPEKQTVFQVDYITFKVARTGAGPRKYAVRSSVDGFKNNIVAAIEKETTDASIAADNSIDMTDKDREYTCQFRVTSGQTLSETIELRFYAWRSESSAAPFKLDDVTVYGTVLQRDTAVAIGSDTLSWTSGLSEVWQSDFTLHPGKLTFTQQLSQPRASSDAAIELCNMHDSLPLLINDVQLQLTDSAGADVTEQFEVKSAIAEEVAALSASVLKIRLIPNVLLTKNHNYTLQGTIKYIDPSDGMEKTTLLYPATVTFQPSAVCEASYFVPDEAGVPMVVQVKNVSSETVYGYEILSGWSGGPGGMMPATENLTDTLRIDSLRKQALFQKITYPLSDTLAWTKYGCETLKGREHPDSMLSEKPVYHNLVKLVKLYGVDHDTLPDMLVDDTPDDLVFSEQIYSSDGHIYKVSPADSLQSSVAILPARDSVAEFTAKFMNEEWCHASLQLPLSMQQRKVRSVERLSDAFRLPADNAWTAGNGKQLHLVDSAAVGDAGTLSERYRVTFSTLELSPVVTEISDSICLGDSYQAHGFDLPSFSESGDYQFADTLLAFSGADSIIQLALNVCSKPSEPGRIIGDSIVLRAGNYQYTISPVPNAAFYVWTVFPPDWQLTGSGETVSLNVPYDGKGVLSVKAVNRCGSSEATVLNLATESRKGAFVVYPDEEDGTFILETTGIEGMTVIAVSDLNGALIYKEEKELSTTDNTFRFTLSQPAGMYIISIVNKNTLTSQKMQK